MAAAALAAIFASTPAHAQGAIQQSGPAAAGQTPMYLDSGHVMAVGGNSLGQPPAPSVNPGTLPSGYAVVNPNLGYCQFTGYGNAPYKSICTGFDGAGNAIMTINGAIYPLPGSGSGSSGLPNYLSPMQFGAVGNGTADDTAAIQAAITQGGLGGQPVWVGDHIYGFRSTLQDNGLHVWILGNGSTGGQQGSGQVCQQGLRALAPGLVGISLTGKGSIVSNICMDAAPGVTNTTGSAISIGVGADNAIISANSINGYCVNVDFSGSSTTNLVDVWILNNTLLPYNASGCAAIRGGVFSEAARTVDARVIGNDIYCGPTNGAQDGLDYYDMGGLISQWNSPYHCNYGTLIAPEANQAFIWASFAGILGDTSTTDGLLINPTAGSAIVEGNNFNATWASASQGTEDILIENTGGTSALAGISFNNHRTYMVGNRNGIVVDAQVKGLDITSSKICGSVTASTGADIILDGPAPLGGPAYVNISDNTLGSCDHAGGTIANGIIINPNVYTLALGKISNNKFYAATTPIAWNITTNQVSLLMGGNYGIDDMTGSPVTDAAQINVGLNPNGYVSGTGTSITTMGPSWNNRKVTLIPTTAGGSTWATGGTQTGVYSPFCAGGTTAVFIAHTFTYDAGIQCWIP